MLGGKRKSEFAQRHRRRFGSGGKAGEVEKIGFGIKTGWKKVDHLGRRFNGDIRWDEKDCTNLRTESFECW
jgi:hypothetical protein